MKRHRRIRFTRPFGLLVAAAVCLLPAFSVTAQTNQPTVRVLDIANQPLIMFPLRQQRGLTNRAFDLGGSETRKLELQLSEPLTLNLNDIQDSSSGVGSSFLDSSLSFRVSDNVDISASLGAGKSQASFQPLGSIHCQNGVLEQGSYRASDCYFINQANVLKQDQIAMNLRYGVKNFTTAINLFKRDTDIGQRGSIAMANTMASTAVATGLLAPVQNNPLIPALAVDQSLSYLQTETTGLGLEFQVGLAMDSAGDIKLGLQLTRVLDASYAATSLDSPGLRNWNLANPFDSARINLDWSKGDFSGGIQGFYREPVQFSNREDLHSLTTFDVEFTWRAPWNANLSVGTTNVLNSGNEDIGQADSRLQDPFESIYGRIPYVRYQQDL